MTSKKKTTLPKYANARACANIALAKYWGKNDVPHNLPAVPSISLTLDRLVTETQVRFDKTLKKDRISLDDRLLSNHHNKNKNEAARVIDMLNRVRQATHTAHFAHVVSTNRFPTAAGLASSASGFAALAAASVAATGHTWTPRRLSALARQSSASAARSMYGGFVELPAGQPKLHTDPSKLHPLAARPLHGKDHWDVRIVVAIAARGSKKVGSTEGMERSRTTSPLYEAWVNAAPTLTRTLRRALKQRNLDQLGAAMEQSTFAFHACAMSAQPSILYWRPPTLAAIETIHQLRARGVSVWATMDAGPHVKALCHTDDAVRVQRALRKSEGILQTMIAKPGPGVVVTVHP